ncbi:MAG: glycosyltransferase [Desulfovibrio sp.]|jgi:hypothetical protein|nr:glycosyltransferase [Desulfovibrio sp.]
MPGHRSSDKVLVWLGNPFFREYLARPGLRVFYDPYSPGGIYTLEDILELTGGVMPDAVLAADVSAPPFVLGMEDFPCLTIFYAVDAHIHSWQPIYARGFDLCLVSLKEYLPNFAGGRTEGLSALHFPPYAADGNRPPEPAPARDLDMVFVGTMNAERAPRRHAFLTELGERFPSLHVAQGPFAALYARAKLILNESARGELNFRVFEALGMGGCLLTPDIGPALSEFFTPGKELFTYPPHAVGPLVALAERLLADDALRERVGAAGLAAVDAGHRASRRAEAFAGVIRNLFASGRAEHAVAARLRAAPWIRRNFLRPLYLHHAESVGVDFMRDLYLEASKKR